MVDLMQRGEIYISIEEETTGECEEDPQKRINLKMCRMRNPVNLSKKESVAPLYVVGQAIVSKALDDPIQRENLFHFN